MTIPKDNSQLENARRLRSEMTPHERKLWYLFLRKYPVKVYKQRIIGRFIVDFYCASAKLVIELDGSQHYEPQGTLGLARNAAQLIEFLPPKSTNPIRTTEKRIIWINTERKQQCTKF